ncbi:MAG: hydroxyacid dehydrogenase [Lachnospiraceae bacterium]|nr:hydroxyacid dehydrogenase [Lachnospiraceae bacterium]
MREDKVLSAEVLESFREADQEKAERDLNRELADFGRKVVVLDDDPTGVQTVHDVSVYTDWNQEAVLEGFREENRMFFLMTNSRGFTAARTAQVHKEIAEGMVKASGETGKDFIAISRSDSTLRGHYPLEPQTLKEELERLTGKRFHGEIIFPFFKEGGRYTIHDIHYVKEGGKLVPAGMTEFAKDKSFGYHSSHLGDWCEEKTGGAYSSDKMVYISLEDLRTMDYERIVQQLRDVENFNKVIVNAIDYVDVKIFCIALIRAIREGKEFIIRSAAAVTKVLGGVPDRPLLKKEELVSRDNKNGGIVIAGSHVNKTTRQLEELKKCRYPVEMIEFNQHLIVTPKGLAPEVDRVVALVNEKIQRGKTVAVYTRRERFDLDTDDKEKQLGISVEISDAVTSIIAKLSVRPNFIIAKGGITSSDVGTKALKVKRAVVMGQIKPGIPVWMTGAESRFPDMPYIIFPGNVGEDTTLREAVEELMS